MSDLGEVLAFEAGQQDERIKHRALLRRAAEALEPHPLCTTNREEALAIRAKAEQRKAVLADIRRTLGEDG